MYKKEFDLFNYEYMELHSYRQLAIGYFFIFLGTSGLIISFFNIINFFMY